MIEGTSPALSADGKTIAYIQHNGGDFSVMRGPTRGAHTAIKQTVDGLDAPALSADGSRIAFQEMLREDWEIFVADIDGKNTRRVTRDIEHDVLPRFVGPDRLLGVIGEPRHRRSFLYDLTSMTRTQAVSQQHGPHDRARVSVGDQRAIAASCSSARTATATPSRRSAASTSSDLQRKVTRTEVLARLRENLKSEVALKEFGTRAFAADRGRREADRSNASRRLASTSTRRRCSTSTRSTSRGPATRKPASTCSTPIARSATSRSISGSSRAARWTARPPTSSRRCAAR